MDRQAFAIYLVFLSFHSLVEAQKKPHLTMTLSVLAGGGGGKEGPLSWTTLNPLCPLPTKSLPPPPKLVANSYSWMPKAPHKIFEVHGPKSKQALREQLWHNC